MDNKKITHSILINYECLLSIFTAQQHGGSIIRKLTKAIIHPKAGKAK